MGFQGDDVLLQIGSGTKTNPASWDAQLKALEKKYGTIIKVIDQAFLAHVLSLPNARSSVGTPRWVMAVLRPIVVAVHNNPLLVFLSGILYVIGITRLHVRIFLRSNDLVQNQST